jgi:Tfp pilus assembly protein PilO
MVMATLVVATGWWLFVWNPKVAQVEAMSERRDAQMVQTQRLRQQMVDVRKYLDGGEAVEREHERVRGWIPPDADLPALIASHDTLARSAPVTVRSFTPQPQDPNDAGAGLPPGVAPLRVNVTVEGSERAADAYLRGLLELPRLIVVDSFRLAPNGDGVVQIDLVLRAFSERPGGHHDDTPEVASDPTAPEPVATGR